MRRTPGQLSRRTGSHRISKRRHSMKTSMHRSLFCLGLAALFTASVAMEAGAAAIKTDLCSRKTGKRVTVTVLKASADFYDVLNEDGERIVLQASGYEQCAGGRGAGTAAIRQYASHTSRDTRDTHRGRSTHRPAPAEHPRHAQNHRVEHRGSGHPAPSDRRLRRQSWRAGGGASIG